MVPENETASVLEYARARLNYPVDYWNGIATLMAMGIPLMLVIAIEARKLAFQALASAAIPVMALACYYTLSRGGVLELAVAIVALLVLLPRRLAAAPILALAMAVSGLLIAAATQRAELEDGLTNAVALEQGDEMLAIVVIVCVGVGLLRVAIGLAARHRIGPRLEISRPGTLIAAGGPEAYRTARELNPRSGLFAR